MKRYILCALGLVLLLFAGCAKQQTQMAYIGAEEAKRLALDASGLTAADVESIATDLSTRDGLDYYQVDFTAAGQDYQYDVDALTGVIIEAHTPSGAVEDSPATGVDTPSANQPIQTIPGSQPPEGNGTSSSAPATTITADEAKAKALTHAGLTSDQVTFIKSKLDYENGRQVYDVEFYTQDSKEYDYEIDASTGEVISYDYDAENYTTPANSGTMITAEKAKELALSQVPGATLDDIRKFEVDYDDGRTEYEGKIIYGGMEYEFEIDGYSGAFRSWEAEPAGR